jgi:cytochrome c-type biogenesis protein CcmH
MGLLSGGDVELRVSRRAIVLAAVATASAAAFAIGLRWAIQASATPAAGPVAATLPGALSPDAPPVVAPTDPSPAASGVPPALPGLEVMVVRLEAKVRDGSGTADQWLLLGQTYRELGRDAEAAAAFERAAALDPAKAAARAKDAAGTRAASAQVAR